MLDGPTDNWPLRITVSSPEEGEIAVQNKVDQGVDFIKVHQQLDGETYLAIARAAVAQDIEFAGHVPGGLSAIQASQAGQGTIEHLSGTPFCTEDDCSALSESIDVFLESGVHHVPTLSVYDAQERNYTTGRIPDGLEAYLSSELLNWWAFQDSVNAKLIPPEFDEPRIREMMIGLRRGALQLTRALHEAGVPILTGTDMSFIGVVAGFSMHSELGFLVEAGLSTAEALRAATVAPVTYLGLQDVLGSVEAGKLADVVVLAQNPLDDISAVNQIIAVITNGDFLDRDTLDAMLEMTRNR